MCRGRTTHLLSRLNVDVGEPCAAQFLADQRDIVMAVRRSGKEPRRVVRKNCGDGVSDVVGKGVFLDAVLGTEDKASVWFQNPTRLGVTSDPVGKKHRAELAAHDVEQGIFKRRSSASACRHSMRLSDPCRVATW